MTSIERNRIWRHKNPEKVRQYRIDWARKNRTKMRDYQRRYLFGLEPEEYLKLLHDQNYLCAICEVLLNVEHSDLRNICHIDHDHKTGKVRGKVRGLLCSNCNKMLGNAKDNPHTLRRAADYLEMTRGR